MRTYGKSSGPIRVPRRQQHTTLKQCQRMVLKWFYEIAYLFNHVVQSFQTTRHANERIFLVRLARLRVTREFLNSVKVEREFMDYRLTSGLFRIGYSTHGIKRVIWRSVHMMGLGSGLASATVGLPPMTPCTVFTARLPARAGSQCSPSTIPPPYMRLWSADIACESSRLLRTMEVPIVNKGSASPTSLRASRIAHSRSSSCSGHHVLPYAEFGLLCSLSAAVRPYPRRSKPKTEIRYSWASLLCISV